MCRLPVDGFSLGDIRQFEHGPVGHHASLSGIRRFSVSYKMISYINTEPFIQKHTASAA